MQPDIRRITSRGHPKKQANDQGKEEGGHKRGCRQTSVSTADTMKGITIEKLKTIISIPNVLKTDL